MGFSGVKRVGRQSFVKGALILLIASVLVRIIGFVYQVIIIRLISTEGIGIFNMIYPLYITAMVLVTAGFPPAVAKSVAEEIARNNRATVENILGTAVTTLLLIASCGSLILVLCAPLILRHIYSDPRVIPSFLILLPSLLMIAVSSTIKGFFQGMQDMRPTALNQLIEQIVRVLSGIGLVRLILPYGLTWATVGLAASVLLSELAGLIYLFYCFKRYSRTIRLLVRPDIKILGKLFAFGIPITVTRVVATIVNSCEASLIPRQIMRAGSSLSQAASFYGELTGVAFTLLMIPSTLSFSLSTSLLPAVSEAQSRNQKELLSHRASYALGITLIAGVPCAIILFNWGAVITRLLFNADQAGYLLRLLSLGSLFLYLSQTTSGILQGTGCVRSIFVNTLVAGFLRLAGIFLFGSHAVYGVAGIALSFVASFVILALLNLIVIQRLAGIRLESFFFLRLALCSGVLIMLLQNSITLVQQNVLLLLFLVLAYILIYCTLLFITGDKYIRVLFDKKK